MGMMGDIERAAINAVLDRVDAMGLYDPDGRPEKDLQAGIRMMHEASDVIHRIMRTELRPLQPGEMVTVEAAPRDEQGVVIARQSLRMAIAQLERNEDRLGALRGVIFAVEGAVRTLGDEELSKLMGVIASMV